MPSRYVVTLFLSNFLIDSCSPFLRDPPVGLTAWTTISGGMDWRFSARLFLLQFRFRGFELLDLMSYTGGASSSSYFFKLNRHFRPLLHFALLPFPTLSSELDDSGFILFRFFFPFFLKAAIFSFD